MRIDKADFSMKDYFQRILLVFPETRYPSGQPPLGLGMLVAISRNLNRLIEVFDMSFRSHPFEDLKEKLISFHPDTVGISIMTPQLADASRTASIVREILPEALIIAGGPHATVLPDDTIRRTGADLV